MALRVGSRSIGIGPEGANILVCLLSIFRVLARAKTDGKIDVKPRWVVVGRLVIDHRVETVECEKLDILEEIVRLRG